MIQQPSTQKNILRDLGDGLILRRAEPDDADALVEFNGRIHSDHGPDQPDLRVGAWVRDLAEKPHPTYQVSDFTLVEDTSTGKIVSSLNLISQTWSYAGIPFGVGRPELVGTDPEYRNRGLVRTQFDVIHQWSAERGELVQGITGIPYYYRLFGYEMALSLGGGRAGFKPHLPKLNDDETEPYRIRPAGETDLSLIRELYHMGSQRSLVSCVMDEDLWRYELLGKSDQNVNRLVLSIIETTEGEPVGCLGHPPFIWGAMLVTNLYELKAGVSWAEVTPTVMRYLVQTGEKYLSDKENEHCEAYGFWFGMEHPVYQVLTDRLPRIRKPYAWYIRVPDLPAFLHRIAPVIETRLAGSPLQGHSGEIKLTFYNRGLRMVFDKGRIVTIENWTPTPVGHSGSAGFPGLTFTQLLFGYRSLDDLMFAFPDCWVDNDTTTALLNAMFPKHYSIVMPVS